MKKGSGRHLPADGPSEHRHVPCVTSAQPYGRKAPSEAVGGISVARALLGSILCTPP